MKEKDDNVNLLWIGAGCALTGIGFCLATAMIFENDHEKLYKISYGAALAISGLAFCGLGIFLGRNGFFDKRQNTKKVEENSVLTNIENRI